MKCLLMFVIMFFSFASFSQQIGVNPRPYDLLRREYKPTVKKMDPKAKSLPRFIQVQKNATLSHTLPNGNKVYALPQDNMPCLVPLMHHFNMPIVGILNPYSRMPGTKPELPPLIEPNSK